MRAMLTSISAILIATMALVAGNALQGTLLAVRATSLGFGNLEIGMLTTGYYLGFMLGCQLVIQLVERVGHIRVFAALASIASASAILYLLTDSLLFWLLIRITTGFCLAGLYSVIESWLNDRATNTNRGRILGAYRVVDLCSNMLGQLMLRLAEPSGYELFVAISVLISLSLVPLTLTVQAAPAAASHARLRFADLIRLSPLGFATVLTIGTTNGAFWGLVPLYILELEYTSDTLAIYMALVVFGGALSQLPFSMISDRLDRRYLIVTASLLASLTCFGTPFLGEIGLAFLLASAFAFGLFAMPLYGLAIAHANDFAKTSQFVAVSAGLLFAFGIGACIGPLAAGSLMSIFGTGALLLFMSFAFLALGVFGVYRVVSGPTVTEEQREPYVSVTRTTPTIFEIDPRSENKQPE